jgi:hypothetical protein
MPSTLINQHTGIDVNVSEYEVVFTNSPIPGEQILVGYNYSTNNVIAEFRGEQIIIGQLPPTGTDNPLRLLLTTQVDGLNGAYIPYEVNFNFSENKNEYTLTAINPFIEVLPRPNLDVTHDTFITNNDSFFIDYTSDATDKVTIEIINSSSVLVYSNYNAGHEIFVTGLAEGTYTISVIAYNEPLINISYVGELIVEGANPEITFANIVILNNHSIEFTYTTLNADYVDIITSFGQDRVSLSPNGTIVFNYLSVNTLYDLTIIARDINSHFDTLDLHFNIILNTVNNTKGILGLKRGKEL